MHSTGVEVARTSPAVLILVCSAVGVVLLMGGGMAMYLLNSSAPPQPAEPPTIVVEPRIVVEPTEPTVTIEPTVTVKPTVTIKPVIEDDPPPTGLTKPDPALRYRVSLEGANFHGAADAPITLAVFYDFQCPFCVRVNKSLTEVTAHYGDDVRIAYMHNPIGFHKDALPAAKAVEAAAAQGKFLEMHELLFADPKALTRSNFDAYARQLGLNKRRFNQVFDDPATEARIMAQQSEALRLKARGTPSAFINGRFLPGAQPFESFSKLIDEELAVADELIAAGTQRGAVYETLMRDALPEV